MRWSHVTPPRDVESLHNILDKRRGWIGWWIVNPIRELNAADIGRTMIYIDGPTREAGTLSSFSRDFAWVRFTTGATAAACPLEKLVFGVNPDPMGPPIKAF